MTSRETPPEGSAPAGGAGTGPRSATPAARWGPPLLLLAGAALLRGYAWLHTTALFNDGPIFIYLAEAVGEGDWPAVFRHPYHPLYPLAMAGAGRWVGGLEQAGILVSIVAGTAAVGMLYLFLREAFGEREALIGGGILALHPTAIDFTSDVQSEGLYIFLFLAALWLSWRGLSRRQPGWAALAGVAVGFAYVTRPEGLVLCAPIAGLAGLQLLRRRWTFLAASAWIGAFALGVAIAATPYVGAIHAATGRWAVTQKYSVAQVFALARPGEEAPTPVWAAAPGSAGPPGAGEAEVKGGQEATSRVIPVVEVAPRLGEPVRREEGRPLARALRALNEEWGAAASALRFSLLPFVLLGAAACWRSFGLRDAFVVAVTGSYGVVLYALALGAGYVSRRHALPPLLPTLGYAAVGVPMLGGLVLALLRGKPFGPRPTDAKSLRTAALLGFVIIAFFAMPRDLRERRSERLAERRAAEWLRDHPHPGGAVAAGRLRAAYYAGEPFVPLPAGQGGDILMYLRGRQVRYVIVDEKRLEDSGWMDAGLGPELELLHRSEARGRSVAVYRFGDGEAR